VSRLDYGKNVLYRTTNSTYESKMASVRPVGMPLDHQIVTVLDARAPVTLFKGIYTLLSQCSSSTTDKLSFWTSFPRISVPTSIAYNDDIPVATTEWNEAADHEQSFALLIFCLFPT
jgi:hypothetical protein